MLYATEACSHSVVECVCTQGVIEGGFAGRTNKLVDGCYTFWQGALVPALAPAYALQVGPQAPPGGAHSARQLASRVVLRPPPAAPPGGPATQAQAAHTQAGHSVPVAMPELLPPRTSLPLRADVLGTGAARHRQWLQQSALAICDPVARAAMASEDPEAALQIGFEENLGQPLTEAHPASELCNAAAAQLWVLQCCQGVRSVETWLNQGVHRRGTRCEGASETSQARALITTTAATASAACLQCSTTVDTRLGGSATRSNVPTYCATLWSHCCSRRGHTSHHNNKKQRRRIHTLDM